MLSGGLFLLLFLLAPVVVIQSGLSDPWYRVLATSPQEDGGVGSGISSSSSSNPPFPKTPLDAPGSSVIQLGWLVGWASFNLVGGGDPAATGVDGASVIQLASPP